MSIGTFCIVIERPLLTAFCPLADGECMWKHHLHKTCTYDEEFAASTFGPEEWAAHTGLPAPDPDILEILKYTLNHEIKASVADD